MWKFTKLRLSVEFFFCQQLCHCRTIKLITPPNLKFLKDPSNIQTCKYQAEYSPLGLWQCLHLYSFHLPFPHHCSFVGWKKLLELKTTLYLKLLDYTTNCLIWSVSWNSLFKYAVFITYVVNPIVVLAKNVSFTLGLTIMDFVIMSILYFLESSSDCIECRYKGHSQNMVNQQWF